MSIELKKRGALFDEAVFKDELPVGRRPQRLSILDSFYRFMPNL